jgi:hypothetical protein
MKETFSAINDWNSFYDRLSLMGTAGTNWKVKLDKNSQVTTKRFLFVTANGESYKFDRKNKTFSRG